MTKNYYLRDMHSGKYLNMFPLWKFRLGDTKEDLITAAIGDARVMPSEYEAASFLLTHDKTLRECGLISFEIVRSYSIK